jgi:hypothetical protein
MTAALSDQPKDLRIVEVRTDRGANAELHRRLRAAAAATIDRLTT